MVMTRVSASALTERYSMASDLSLYAGGGALLKEYLMAREVTAMSRGRYVYGSLEYPYTFTAVQPDKTSISNAFPPGRFHQDTYVGNPDIFNFYINTLAPLFNSTQSFFFHLDDSIIERDAALNLDVAILALLSHRCVLMLSSHLFNFHTSYGPTCRASIGKIVAESKYAADPNSYTPLIRAQDSAQIRVLLTNTTQEAAVLAQAATAASAFTMAWNSSEAAPSQTLSGDLVNIASTVFRNLIDVTTNVEIEYVGLFILRPLIHIADIPSSQLLQRFY